MSSGILHLGAHRTGTTSLQMFLLRNQQLLIENGIDIMCPPQTRHMNIDALQFNCDRFVVSEENILGTMENNLWMRSLYPDVVNQVKRYERLTEQITIVYLTIRNYADWWNSAFSFCVANGAALPNEEDIGLLAKQQRGWCEVVHDLKTVFPRARLVVREFFWKTDNPKQQLRSLTRWNEWSQTSIDKTATNIRPPTSVLCEKMLASGNVEHLKYLDRSNQIQLFSRSELERLNVKYLRDLAQLVSTKDIELWCNLEEVEQNITNRTKSSTLQSPQSSDPQTHCLLQFGKTRSGWIARELKTQQGTSRLKLASSNETLSTTIGSYGRHRKLAFVFRHPASRFQASFYSRMRQGRPKHQADWTSAEAISFTFFDTANSLAEALSSADERMKSAALFAFKNIQHIRSTYRYFLHSPAALDSEHSVGNIVFCCEDVDLRSHAQSLFTLLGRSAPKSVPELTDRTWVGTSALEELSDLAMRNLEELWAEDFEIYRKCKSIAQELGYSALSSLEATEKIK